MFRHGFVFVLAFGLLATSVLAQPEPGKRHTPEINPCYLSVNPVGPVVPGEPTQLEACIRSEWSLDTLTVVFTPSGAIQYLGQTEWRQVVNAGDSIVFPLEVTYPPNDTAGFELVGYNKMGAIAVGGGFYVVSTEDSIKTFPIDPRKLPKNEGLRYSKEFLDLLNKPRTSSEDNDTTKVKVTTGKLTDVGGKSSGIDVGPCGMTIHRLSPIIPGEPAKMEVYIRSSVFLDTLTFLFVPFGVSQYSGQTEWRQVVNVGDTLSFPLEVVFAENDTSGFEVTTTRKGARFLESGFYVVSTGDSVKTSQVDPRSFPKDTVQPSSEGYFQQPHDMPPHDERGDTVKSTTYMPTDRDRMKEKERTPLTDADEQHIIVDGEFWYRKRGEYEFKKSIKYSSPQEHVRVREAELDEKYKDVKHETTMDLRDTADYTFAKGLFGNRLKPMDSAGFYHANISKLESRPLAARKIRLCLYPDYPREGHEPTPAERDAADRRMRELHEKSSTKSPKQTSQDVLVSYDFETYWYDNWYSWDENEENGRDYWYDVYIDSAEVHSGEFSAWCAANGNMPDGVQYDNCMWAWLEPGKGIYVGGHQNIKLKYWLWYDTEYDYDFCEVYWSYDGLSWANNANQASGNSWGWEECELDIPKDGDSVFVAFLFYSDPNYCNYRGVFIDDISVTGDPTANLPNLTYTTPWWWDGPIVPSSVQGTNDTGNLCGNSPTYIDVAVTNSGNATADPFYVSLYRDGGILVTKFEYNSYLFPGAYKYFEDYKAYISAGYHSLTMIIDPDGLIEETCETDNVYEKVFYWPAPGIITVSGWATYQDMNPPSSGKNARNMKIQMWDYDTNGDDLLDSTWTTASGAFSFGTVSNADETWLGRQDIYLKFYAENDAAYMNNGHNGSRITYKTGVQSEVPNGTLSLGTVNIPGPQSGPFFIVDKIKNGRDKWLSYQQSDPGKVETILRNGGGSEYVSGYIVIDSSINDNFYRPDVFDGYVVLHEYGHWLADSIAFFCVGSGTHSWHTRSTDTLAASEAFAHFWPAVIADNPIQKNYYNSFASYYGKNLENGEYGINGNSIGSPNDLGPDCEGTVAGVLWDLYDNNDDDYTMWKPGYPGVGQPDSIWDLYDNGITNILKCLTQRNTDAGHHPLNIYEFWNVWFQSPSLGNPQQLWAVYREHDINMDIVAPTGSIVINNGASMTQTLTVALAVSATDTLSGMAPPLAKMRFSNDNSTWSSWETFATSKTNWNLSAYGGDTTRTTKTVYVQFKDVAGNPSVSYSDNIIYRDYICGDANDDETINAGDAVFIINYLFKSGATPNPIEAGDANCDYTINAGDAVYIMNYIFKGGAAPCCP